MITEVEKIIVDIIKSEMVLTDTYGKDIKENDIPCILIRSQNMKLGETDKLQIIVGMVDGKVVASNNYSDFVSIVQNVTYDADAGTFVLFYDSTSIGTFAYNVTAATIQAAFDASSWGQLYFSVATITGGFAISTPRNLTPSTITTTSNLTKNSDPVTITITSVQTPTEIQQVQMSENIQIDIQSRNNDARTRRWEIIAALQSIYAKQKMEENSFKIFRIPRSFVNSGMSDGGSVLNRFSIVINCYTWYNKTKNITEYYDDFNTRVDDESTITEAVGAIEIQEP